MAWDLFRVVEPNVLSSKVENFSEFWQHFQDLIPSPWSPKSPPNSAKTVFAEKHHARDRISVNCSSNLTLFFNMGSDCAIK
jgi:hypothetical protein